MVIEKRCSPLQKCLLSKKLRLTTFQKTSHILLNPFPY